MKLYPAIGLEIHVELNTASKMFCGCPTNHFGHDPNTIVCPVCLGMPGTLPVPNSVAIESTIKLAASLNCAINPEFNFARKHYFYPDLPKGYQITQFTDPIGVGGEYMLRHNGSSRSIRIERVHIEEDTGKLIHTAEQTLIDFNRAGVPLVEIVTRPDLTSSDQVVTFLKELQLILRYLGISEAAMEKGQMRLEPNISLSTQKSTLADYKVELKNINSFKYVKDAINYELDRQTQIYQKGQTPRQVTRGYDPKSKTTFLQREKETAHDYRYFPEPDIPPIQISTDRIQALIQSLPLLPRDYRRKYREELLISDEFADIIVSAPQHVEQFEKMLAKVKDRTLIAELTKWFVRDYLPLTKQHPPHPNFKIEYLVELITMLQAHQILPSDLKRMLRESITTGNRPQAPKSQAQSSPMSDAALRRLINQVLQENRKVVADINKGQNPNAIQFIVGKVIQQADGTTPPAVIARMVKQTLNQ